MEPPIPPYNSTDPSASFLSSSALDFLLIEIVPLAYRITAPDSPDADLTVPDDETTDAARYRLESAGYRVGQGLVERLLCLDNQ